MNNFDAIAFVYDPLAKLVFGKSHRQSQNVFLAQIPNAATVLILGGGAGNIVVDLMNLKPTCKIFYIDASKNMMYAAKAKCTEANQIQFIHGTEDDIPEQVFDVVITNFYLDLFNSNNLQTVMHKINNHLRTGSKWLVTDFINGNKRWQLTLLKIMYMFFKVTCKIEANNLPEWQSLFCQMNFLRQKEEFFFHGFIRSELYEKKDSL